MNEHLATAPADLRGMRIAAVAQECLLRAVDAADHVTGAHLRRVAAYALLLARGLRLTTRQQRSIERVALFHDIGKIDGALFDIIHSRHPLTARERRAIVTHPDRGARVVAPLGIFYPDLVAGIRSHHERWDGAGYPRGLRREEIPLSARVVAIADTFDAITYTRRYHVGQPAMAGARAIRDGRGSQFDPTIVETFLARRTFDEVLRLLERIEGPPAPRQGRPVIGAERRQPPGDLSTTGPDAPDIRFRWRLRHHP